MAQPDTGGLDLHAGYQGVSAGVEDEHALVRFLDEVDEQPAVRAYKRRMRELLALQPGETVLETGCGADRDLVRDAAEVGHGGEVIGLDVNATMVIEARRRTAGWPQVACDEADARALPRPDASVDACRVDRTLMYVSDPALALAELARVLRPGGRLAAMELDYGALLLDHPDAAFTPRIEEALRAALPEARLGRQLRRLLAGAGLERLTVSTHGIELTPHLLARLLGPTLRSAVRASQLPQRRTEEWITTLQRHAHTGFGFASFTGLVALAPKPH